MRLEILYLVEMKYKNNVIPRLPEIIIRFLDKNPNYMDLFKSKIIKVNDILYYLRNKQYKTRKELLELVLIYVEMKHGIFERAKRYATSSSNNNQ